MSAALLVLTPVLGIAVRFAHLGLPWTVRKYGGSVLWAAMVYWVCSTLLQRVRVPLVAGASLAVAVAVEFLKRVHSPGLEAFRGTLAGVLLLGREFSYADILAYTLAVIVAAVADASLLRPRPVG